LTISGIQAKICLPPSRRSLTRYALENRGALRMIRVSVFSHDLCLRGAGVYLYSPELTTWVLGSNRLKEQCRCNLGVSGNRHNNWETNGGVHRPPGPMCTPSRSASVESLLESFRTLPRRFHGGIALLLLTCRSALTVYFWHVGPPYGIYYFKSLDLCWWSQLCPYTCYVDGLIWLLTTVNREQFDWIYLEGN
jgi:hypothetical protein